MTAGLPSPETAPRRRRLGPYRLGLLLGEGGMGEVYKAFDQRLERWVAVKCLRGEATAEARARFRREARSLARLGHPAIVQIFDVLEDEEGDWIVMELVEGSTLAELAGGAPLDVGLALDAGRQIAGALGAAHTEGIVHRDLKTENVMALPSGYVKVLDFGLARGAGSPVSEIASATGRAPRWSEPMVISRPGRVAGTPRAMSPEQAAGGEVDARSDLFSLGVLLYEVSTARSPFAGRNLKETLERVARHREPPARRLNPRVPRRLSELVARLLAKDPAQRPRSAGAVEIELAAIAASDPVYRVTSRDLARAGNGGAAALALDVAATTADVSPAGRDDAVLATLLGSHLDDFTRGVETLGDRDSKALLERNGRLARELMEQHGGRRIEGAGGDLLIFDRPWNAIGYALAYQAALREAAPPACEEQAGARIGIHLGEVIVRRNLPRDVGRGARPIEVEGPSAPNVARLAALAGRGQTLLTRAAYEMARRGAAGEGEKRLAWRAHGRYRFRGVAGEVEIFEVGVPGVAPLSAPAGSREVKRLGPVEAGVTVAALPAFGRTSPRIWPPPEVPEQPYPALLPYNHPDFMAGRDRELARLRRLLAMPMPILGLSAPSGVGKSSLLAGGLVPALRAAGPRGETSGAIPVALVRHPAEPGVASRLIGDLLDGAGPVDDGDASGFARRLSEVERLTGATPILVLDQFDDVLRDGAAEARAVLGVLMASTAARRPGLETPVCRWLIAYRQELYGRLSVWLADVLADARVTGATGLEALPHDLSTVERFHGMTLAPLATPVPGNDDPLAEATRVFQAAIEKPLASGSFPWRFPAGYAERLARAFAEARLARSGAPLAPELQVVLAHLLARAGEDGLVEVPEDPGSLIDRALEDHLRRALEAAFPEGTAASANGRARALLALRALADADSRRHAGLGAGELARAIGRRGKPLDGEEVLEALATPLTRLVVVREAEGGPRWVLAHGRMGEAVARLVDEEGRRGRMHVDHELLGLRRFVDLRLALFRSGETKAATRMSRRRYRRLRDHADALLWDDDARAWLAACVARRRADRRRQAALVAAVALVLAFIGLGAWTWAQRQAEQRALLEQVADGEPEAALRAFYQLTERPGIDAGRLLGQLKQREVPMDVLELGLGGLDDPHRSAAVLRAVEVALPWVEETPEDPFLVANLVWGLDYAPGRDSTHAARARDLRGRALAPLRRLRPPPPFPAPGDPEWIEVPAGRFLMGTAPGDAGSDRERPQHEVAVSAFRMLRHEVTNAEYRRLVPGHDPSAGADLPARDVNWYRAYVYAAWLGGRLPTEAEWEVAARAGCPYAYCTRGGAETTVQAVAWTQESAREAGVEPEPRPVMLLEPNPWGFYDMLGNLWEWTADWSGPYPPGPRSDPWGPPASSGGTRVVRGGAFHFWADRARVAHRTWAKPGTLIVKRGVRPVLQSGSTTRRP